METSFIKRKTDEARRSALHRINHGLNVSPKTIEKYNITFDEIIDFKNAHPKIRDLFATEIIIPDGPPPELLCIASPSPQPETMYEGSCSGLPAVTLKKQEAERLYQFIEGFQSLLDRYRGVLKNADEMPVFRS